MVSESTVQKLGTPDFSRNGIHLVYSRNWSYQQRQMSAGTAPHRESPQYRFSLAMILATAAMTVPAAWACHSILHSLHLL